MDFYGGALPNTSLYAFTTNRILLQPHQRITNHKEKKVPVIIIPITINITTMAMSELLIDVPLVELIGIAPMS